MPASKVTATRLEMGIVGLGRMGGGLAQQALEKDIRVVGMQRDVAPQELLRAGLVEATSLEDFTRTLRPPRSIFLYIPAGAIVDHVMEQLLAVLEPEDIIVDGGNSYWGDSIRRAKWLAEHGLGFVDLGTSGGVSGARHGLCFMAGGPDRDVARVEPLLETLSVPCGYVHAGSAGAGHFSKLVHNGIEFGMLQAIGEGVALLEAYGDGLPVAEVLRCWQNGSVIRSWLIDLMEEQYRMEGGIDHVPSHVDDTGEVNWLVADALAMEVPVPVIAQSVMQLVQSRDASSRSARAIALMRRGFGGHALGPNAAAAHERRAGRVGEPWVAPDGEGKRSGKLSDANDNPRERNR